MDPESSPLQLGLFSRHEQLTINLEKVFKLAEAGPTLLERYKNFVQACQITTQQYLDLITASPTDQTSFMKKLAQAIVRRCEEEIAKQLTIEKDIKIAHGEFIEFLQSKIKSGDSLSNSIQNIIDRHVDAHFKAVTSTTKQALSEMPDTVYDPTAYFIFKLSGKSMLAKNCLIF